MKLLLLKDVDGLGKPGELVNVSPGYARNYLFPRNLAAEPTPQALRRVEAGRRKVDESWLRLERPIKEVGIYDVPVVVHGETRATVKVWVVEEKNKD